MPYVPPSGGGAPTSLDAGHSPVRPLREGLAQNPQAFRPASQGFAGYAARMNFFPETNLPFNYATRCLVDSKEGQGLLGTLEHCIKIGSVGELPLETFDGPRLTFF